MKVVVLDWNWRSQYKFMNFSEYRPTETRVAASVYLSVASGCVHWQPGSISTPGLVSPAGMQMAAKYRRRNQGSLEKSLILGPEEGRYKMSLNTVLGGRRG